jgi:hypothetical protein
MTLAPLSITDPQGPPRYRDSALSRWCQARLFEPRDEVFVRLTVRSTLVMVAAMALLATSFHWALGAVYLALWGWMTPPVILMLHNTMHRPLFKSARGLNRAHPYLMSFFFGIPTGYMEHHLGMHHVENNLFADLSSTMRFRRDSFPHFLIYFSRFFFLVILELPRYLIRKGRSRLAWRAVVSELAHQALIIAVMVWNWRFGLVAFALPYVLVRFMMMAGNWGQHAFLHPERPGNSWVNSITCINNGYNRRAFNDGYHIGHHLKASRHWTELPTEFLENRAQYHANGCVVFERLDFFMVSVLLWLGRYDVLANHFVELGAERRPREHIIAFLKSRTRPFLRDPIGASDAVEPMQRLAQ